MRKIISVLLILATLVGCCTGFLACGNDDDNENTFNGYQAIENSSQVILDFDNASNITDNKLTVSSTVIGDFKSSAEWVLDKKDRTKNKIELSLNKTDLSDFREIAFWMYNDSQESIKFSITLVTGDGTEYKSYATYTNIEAAGTKYKVEKLIAHPGWHEYKLPFSETDAYKDLTWQYAVPNEDTAKNFEAIERFDSDNIVKIILDASGDQVLSDVKLYITSIGANTRKTGTILGYQDNFDHLANAVVFYEDGNAYLYNQARYMYSFDREGGIKTDGNSTLVPIAILAQHRGATNLSATKEKVTFTYNGVTHTFENGQKFDYTGDKNGFKPGLALTSYAVVNGDYLTIPMEIAAAALGYELHYDQMGLVFFTDQPDLYVHLTDPNYKGDEIDDIPGHQIRELYAIIQIINLEKNTGAEMIEDMNAIYGEDGHSKLMVNQEMFDALKKQLEEDPVYASWFNRYESANAVGTSSYKSKNPVFELSDGYRLLQMSRDVMECLIKYSFLYKMTDNPDYGEKVLKTMKAVAKFKDSDLTNEPSWHPEHFLDTGEMCYGMGIAYDWCYDYIADVEPEALKTIENAVWNMGYGAAMGFGPHIDWWRDSSNLQEFYNEQKQDGVPMWNKHTFNPWYLISDTTWAVRTGDYTAGSRNITKFNFNNYKATNNWNAVCNGGIGVMALAFANVNDEFRAASEYLLDCISFSLHGSLFESYAPDGGYPEGPGYWGYGTSYSIFLFQSLITATGSDQGLTKIPGFRESFYFISGVTSFDGGHWNYHDAGTGGNVSSQYFFWYSDTTNDTDIGGLRYNDITSGRAGVAVWDLMFYSPTNYNENVSLELDYCYQLIGITTFRSDWTGDAMFAGLHGGANAASHGQIDIGTFIVEFGGTRFFQDLGSDEYNLTGYSDGNTVTYFSNPYRYWYYRMRAEGHNTLVINPVWVNTKNTANSAGSGTTAEKLDNAQGKNYDQLYAANSKILSFISGKTSALSIVDMACAYREAAATAYECAKCGYFTGNIHTCTKCEESTAFNLVTDEATGKVYFECANPECKNKNRIAAVCPNAACGEQTLTERIGGYRGLLVTDNRATVVIQDEIQLNEVADKVYWMGHVIKGATVKLSKDAKSATIEVEGKVLLVEIMTPYDEDDEEYVDWKFELRMLDYLEETKLQTQAEEYARDGMQKLVAVATNTDKIELAVTFRLLSSGPHEYDWTPISHWATEKIDQ